MRGAPGLQYGGPPPSGSGFADGPDGFAAHAGESHSFALTTVEILHRNMSSLAKAVAGCIAWSVRRRHERPAWSVAPKSQCRCCLRLAVMLLKVVSRVADIANECTGGPPGGAGGMDEEAARKIFENLFGTGFSSGGGGGPGCAACCCLEQLAHS